MTLPGYSLKNSTRSLIQSLHQRHTTEHHLCDVIRQIYYINQTYMQVNQKITLKLFA